MKISKITDFKSEEDTNESFGCLRILNNGLISSVPACAKNIRLKFLIRSFELPKVHIITSQIMKIMKNEYL